MISFLALIALEGLGHVEGWHWLIWLAALMLDGHAYKYMLYGYAIKKGMEADAIPT